MSTAKISYTQITHDIVQQATEPLPFDDLLAAVAAVAPITTKNPRQTIRNAISGSRLIVATGDGRYGWKPRLITGARLRLRLAPAALEAQRLLYSDELLDGLYPAFFETGKRADRGPASVTLPNGAETTFTLEHGQGRLWGTAATPEFWQWLSQERAAAEDDLIVTVMDGEARRYAVALERQSERDQQAIQARDRELIAVLLPMANRRSETPIWDITTILLVGRHYHHPIPPHPLSVIMSSDEWQAATAELGLINGWAPLGLGVEQTIFGPLDQLLDRLETHEFPVADSRSPAAQTGESSLPFAARQPGPTFLLRVTHRERPDVWRDIEIAADQTLEDLHLAIQAAYNWDNDHLYSFFLNGRAWDDRSEVGSPWSDSERHTDEVRLHELRLKPKRKLLYLFDYGDEHEFDVEVMAINEQASGASYPRIVGRKGRAPRQYR